VPKVEISELRKLAEAGGGVSTLITRGGGDLNAVFNLSASAVLNDPNAIEQDARSDYWVEYGVWVLPIVMLLALGFFRRGLMV